jgi:hypothetical protein
MQLQGITSNSQKEKSHWEVGRGQRELGEGAHLDGVPLAAAGILLVLLVRRLGYERRRLLLLVWRRAM